MRECEHTRLVFGWINVDSTNSAQTLQKDLVLNEHLTSPNCSRGWLKRSQMVIYFLMQNSNQFSHCCNYCNAEWAENDWGRNYQNCHSEGRYNRTVAELFLSPLCTCSTQPLWSHCQSSQLQFSKLCKCHFIQFLSPILILCTSLEFSVSKVQVLMVPKFIRIYQIFTSFNSS